MTDYFYIFEEVRFILFNFKIIFISLKKSDSFYPSSKLSSYLQRNYVHLIHPQNYLHVYKEIKSILFFLKIISTFLKKSVLSIHRYKYLRG